MLQPLADVGPEQIHAPGLGHRSEKRLAPTNVVVSRNSIRITERGGPSETSWAARCSEVEERGEQARADERRPDDAQPLVQAREAERPAVQPEGEADRDPDREQDREAQHELGDPLVRDLALEADQVREVERERGGGRVARHEQERAWPALEPAQALHGRERAQRGRPAVLGACATDD